MLTSLGFSFIPDNFQAKQKNEGNEKERWWGFINNFRNCVAIGQSNIYPIPDWHKIKKKTLNE